MGANAFKTLPLRQHVQNKINSKRHVVPSLLEANALEAIREPVQNYVNLYLPTFTAIKDSGVVPEFLLKWGHGSAMSTVLFVMGGIGAYLGWQIRLGNGENTYSFTLGKTAREQHPLIMGLATFFFLLGGQGGLVLLATQGKPILESPHAVTGFLGLGLLAFQVPKSSSFLSLKRIFMFLYQAALPVVFGKGNATARTVHAYLGSAIMVLLLVHFYNGVNLGISL